MITIIGGTNRPDSATEIVAQHYYSILKTREEEVQLLSLRDLPHEFAFSDVYGKRTEPMKLLVAQYIEAADKFLFVIPEYNGSFPGVLKTFIDAVHPKHFMGKKAAIVGLSEGHSGNLRGQDHLTGILHYLRMQVHYSKPKLSGIETLLNAGRMLVDEKTLNQLEVHAGLFVKF
ncbi:MAG: NAD(P)H-dependent oxidoreductase [Flavobacteriales bacterium]|nr:NAD(P)H-dependent oxidoreductase [Flavobacteriales bacterium]